jgi:hypothetical protein
MNAGMMDHEEAIKNFTVERYLLGELTESDRDAYEEHLFSCPVCFEQVKAGTEFVGQVRQIGAEESRSAARPGLMGVMSGLRQPVAAVALTLLFCAIGLNVYQGRMITASHRVQVAPAFILSDGAKAEGIKEVTVPKNTRFNLNFQLLKRGPYTRYEGQVVTESGKINHSFQVSVEQASEIINLLLDSGTMGEGIHQIVIQGVSADGKMSELTRYTFNFRLQE